MIASEIFLGCRQETAVNARKKIPFFFWGLFVLVSVLAFAGKSLAETIEIDTAATRLQLTELNPNGPSPKLILYTTMATWCVACREELPQFLHLHSMFKPEELGMYGLPYDDKEGPGQIKAWAATNRPPYQLLTALTKNEIASLKSLVLKTLRIDAVPVTIVTDNNGRILRTRWGPPSVSELRELLRMQRNRM